MHLLLPFLLLLLASLVSAQTPTGPYKAIPFPSDYIGRCTKPKDMVNNTTPDAPLVEDCMHLLQNIAKGGRWTTRHNRRREIARYGSCHFGVKKRSKFTLDFMYLTYSVEMEDVRYAILESIKEFGSEDGHVAAEGKFACLGPQLIETLFDVDWYIY
ncbi:hypothetical protein OQA88_7392 [Cercophora sp. LCS_1]